MGSSGEPKSNRLLRALIPIIAGLIVLMIPKPADLPFNAWAYLALFVAVIVGLITEPLPSAAIGFIGIVVAAVFGLVDPTPKGSIKWALSGFSNSVIWLIFAGYMFATAFRKTGLGKRIALYLIRAVGKKSLGLGYAGALIDAVLGPFIPSNTARCGGVIYPIISNIPPLYGSEPNSPTAKKIGSYLMWTTFASDSAVSSLFLTGLAPNLLVIALAAEVANINITWTEWFVSGIPVLLALVLIPLLAYKIYPPEIKESPEAVEFAKNELVKMGKPSNKEIILAALMAFALAMWVAGGQYLHSATVALLVLALMLIFKILDWDDVLLNKGGWNVLIWFGTLVTLAGGLTKVGLIDWMVNSIGGVVGGLPAIIAMIILATLFYWLHYGFASMTAHVTALYTAFLSMALAVPGLPAKAATLILGHAVGLFGVISPYATGPAPIFYGSGYIPSSDFWKLGVIFGIFNYVILTALILPWNLMLFG